jgi:hypothetical protein
VPVQRLSSQGFEVLSNPGVTSVQIVWKGNAPEAQVTITRVTMEPGAVSPRHMHPRSEQTWIVETGAATLLLAGDQTQPVGAGDVIRARWRDARRDQHRHQALRLPVRDDTAAGLHTCIPQPREAWRASHRTGRSVTPASTASRRPSGPRCART